jgi:hypothetical protein
MIAKFPFQSHAILILSIAEIQHQDKGADRKHTGWEEKRRPMIERNPDDQCKRDQVVQRGQPERHEYC